MSTMASAVTKTASELLFEEYLKSHGFSSFDYEPKVDGTDKRPDYRVAFDGQAVHFEVKEFEAQPIAVSGFGYFDPYEPVRVKIERARTKFRDLKGRPCSLVLANPQDAFVHLDELAVLGAMLGAIGWTMPFDPERQMFDSTETKKAFLDGGKMIRYKGGKPLEPQNTTISAIVVLGSVAEGTRRFNIWANRREVKLGRRFSFEEQWQEMDAATGSDRDLSIHRLRVVVYENPFAVQPLSQAFGVGPYDERYGIVDSRLARRFVGNDLKCLEDEEAAVGIIAQDPLHLRR